METRTVDVAVIGAGTAGLNAQRAASKAGARALLIERGPLGTTCARVGCMPSKLLIAASDAAHAVHDAGGFGIRVGDVEVDGRAVLRRVRAERDRFVSFVLDDCRVLIVRHGGADGSNRGAGHGRGAAHRGRYAAGGRAHAD